MRSPRRRFLSAAALALPLSPSLRPLSALAQIAPTLPVPADWEVPDGHFYTQTAPPTAPKDNGFVVSNAQGVRLLRGYRDLGGPAHLGYPISDRFESEGEIYQATQAGLLHWNAAAAEAQVYPIFRAFAEMELDGWLEGIGIPPVAPELLEYPDLSSDIRLSWLTNDYLRAAYGDSLESGGLRRLGLPMGEPQRFGAYLAQRFERAVLQLWLDDVPGQPSAGTITLVQVGALLREAEMIPSPALEPVPAPAPRPVPAVQAPSVAGVSPLSEVDGKHIIISLSRQWWYAYESGRLEYNGPVTTGRPELYTPTGRFSIMSKRSPFTFVSPWPPGNPFWYETATSSYALQITGNGIFLHDAPWRPFNGPGTNVPHTDPDGVWRTGSHGCINMPLAAAAWAYRWAPMGMPVDVIA